MIAPKRSCLTILNTKGAIVREYINEATWCKILMFLEERKDIYIGDENRCKRFMEAIYWMSRTGAQWRELPEEYGNWNTVYVRFNEWSKKNIWRDFLTFCIQEPDLEWFSIDATILRAHPCAAGYKRGKQAEEALGRSKGGFTCKFHATVDALGNLLRFILTPGQASDITQGPALIFGFSAASVLADRGYDCDEFRTRIKMQNCDPVIPPRANRKKVVEYDKDLYKERNAIECFFSKIKHFRRIFSRFDKSARNFGAFISFVGALLWLR
jgi:transposase